MDGKILITGKPGCGKSTVVRIVVEKLKDKLQIGGIVTPEIRRNGVRIGFKVVDIASGNEKIFAEAGKEEKHSVGKYGVDITTFESVALPALSFAVKNCQLIVIDEIGKMELLSKEFEKIVEDVLKGNKPVLAVVHRNFLDKYKKYGEVICVERKDIEKIVQYIITKLKYCV